MPGNLIEDQDWYWIGEVNAHTTNPYLWEQRNLTNVGLPRGVNGS